MHAQSADDEEILLYIPFMEKVNINSIAFRAENDGEGHLRAFLAALPRPQAAFRRHRRRKWANSRAIHRHASAAESAPAVVKLFVNRSSMSFEDAEDAATQTLELTEKDFEERSSTMLRFARFQRVSSLTVRRHAPAVLAGARAPLPSRVRCSYL